MDKHSIQKLARELTVGLCVVISLTATILVTTHYFCYSVLSQRQMNARMNDTYDLAKAMVIPIWNADINMIRQMSEAYLTCEYISGIMVETDYGKILYENLPASAGKSFIREERIRQSDHYFGRLKLQFSREGTERTMRKTIIAVILVSLPVISTIIIGSHFIIKSILNKALKSPDS